MTELVYIKRTSTKHIITWATVIIVHNVYLFIYICGVECQSGLKAIIVMNTFKRFVLTVFLINYLYIIS